MKWTKVCDGLPDKGRSVFLLIGEEYVAGHLEHSDHFGNEFWYHGGNYSKMVDGSEDIWWCYPDHSEKGIK